jgi:hypothetical protein
MNLASNIKPFPKFFSRFSFKGITLIFFKRIYLQREIFDNLKSDNPTIQNISVLKHEQVHLKRAGKARVLKYLLSSHRLREELIAYREQFKYLKKNNSTYDLENVAKHLPGVKRGEAKKIIAEIWNES